MRIAMISDCYPPHMGGIESQVEGMARQLALRGHHVEVVTATPGPEGAVRGSDLARGTGRLEVTRAALNLPGFLPVNPFAGKQIARALGRCEVAHIHMGVVSPLALHALAIATRRRVPTVVTFHCMLDGWSEILKRAGIYHVEKSPVVPSAVSSTLAEQVKRVARVDDVLVIPNGVALSRWRHIAACRPMPPAPNTPLQLVTAMRFMPRKRPFALVATMRRVRDQLGPQCPHLAMFGEGAQYSAVKTAIGAAGMGDLIECPGRKTESQLQMEYLHADAFVLPSKRESFGIAALEARAAGLPVIAYRSTGTTDFLTDGLDSLLVGESGHLADAIVRLVREPDLLKQLQTNAVEPTTLSWQTSIDAVFEAYDRATRMG